MVKPPNQTLNSQELPVDISSIEKLTDADVKSYVYFFSKIVTNLSFYSDQEKQEEVSERDEHNISKKIRNDGWLILVAKNRAGEIVGSVEGRILKTKSGNLIGNVVWVLTDDSKRSRRIGNRMSLEFETMVEKLGCKNFILTIKDYNKNSISMHKKRGYKIDRDRSPKIEGANWYKKELT